MRYSARFLYVFLHFIKLYIKKVFTSVLFTAIFLSICSFAYAFQVTLAWDPNDEPDVVGYKTYYGTESRNYTGNVDVGNYESVTISDLVPGKKYYFAVTAYDLDDNESDFSAEISFQVPNSMPWVRMLLLDD